MKKIYLDAISTFGVEAQLNQVKEEAAELIVAVSHYQRERIGLVEIADEIADVTIMLEQLVLLLDAEQLVGSIKIIKLDRLRESVDKHRGEKDGYE